MTAPLASVVVSREKALRDAIDALERQSNILGADAVEAATAPLRAELETLESGGGARRSERLRLVTILFADVVGSTMLARRLDPEDIHSVMDPALERLTAVIGGHGGRVLQYAGDSLLAVFGAEASSEDDARLAVRAGLDVVAQSTELADRLETRFGVRDFSLRVGLHTGRVLLGAGVDGQNSIRGMPVNVAARMEQAAPPAGVLISQATWRLVRGAFVATAQPPLRVKGIEASVQTYLIEREQHDAARTVSRGVDGLDTELIGRVDEQAALNAALASVGEGESRQPMVLLLGDAGLGKTRLVSEFERGAVCRPGGAHVLHARALVQTEDQPFGVLRDLLWRRLGLRDRRADDGIDDTFCSAIEQVGGRPVDDDDRLLGHLLGLSLGDALVKHLDNPRLVRDRAVRAADRLLKRDADRSAQTMVVVLDDLHWADDDSLTWVADFANDVRGRRILLIGMARHSLFLRRPLWPGDDLAYLRLDLEPLTASASTELVENLLRRLDDVPTGLRDQMTRNAEGNPFYMEEIVKMLIDDGVIVSAGATWRLENTILPDLRIPDTLAGVLQARMDRLSAAARRALRQASIAGYEFWDDGIAAIDASAIEHLPQLIERGFIVPMDASTVAGARQYRFHHHALHQVVRNSVLKADRAGYHLAIGRWLARRAGARIGEFHARIAEHLERGGDSNGAVAHYAAGAVVALDRHSHDAVLAQTQRGLELLSAPAPALRWRLRRARERVLSMRGDRTAHQVELDQLHRLADELDDDARRAEAHWREAAAVCHAGDYRATVPLATRASELARVADAPAIAAAAMAAHATALRRLGDFDGARRVAEEGLTRARACGSVLAEKELVYSLAALAAESGQLDESRRLDHMYLDLAKETDDRVMQATGLNLLGDNAYRGGDLESAREHFDRSYSLAVETGYAYGQCIAALNLAMVAIAQKDFAEARRFGRLSVEQARAQAAGDLEAVALMQLGLAESGVGDHEAAHRTLVASSRCYAANGSGHLCAEVDSALARLALKTGDVSRAADLVGPIVERVNSGDQLDGTEDPLRIRWDCYVVLKELDDARAPAWLSASHAALMASAGQLADSRRREQFVHALPHRRRLDGEYKKHNPRDEGG